MGGKSYLPPIFVIIGSPPETMRLGRSSNNEYDGKTGGKKYDGKPGLLKQLLRTIISKLKWTAVYLWQIRVSK